jgi:hypothetical protein
MSCNSGESKTRLTSRSSSSLRLLGWLLSVTLIVTVSNCVGGVSLAVGEDAVEEGNDVAVTARALEVASPLPGRVKRSRDVQQLCGYRLLDALRSVCDRNFVGFARRSDPSLFLHPGGDGQSEEVQVFGSDPNLNTWDVLGMEYPSFVNGGGDIPPYAVPSTTTNTPLGMGGNLLDYLELLQQPSPLSPSLSPNWMRNGGAAGGSGSTKAFALKMLAEPPKTHQRFRRNIIDECCKKPCAMGQMLKYCAITGVGKRGGN